MFLMYFAQLDKNDGTCIICYVKEDIVIDDDIKLMTIELIAELKKMTPATYIRTKLAIQGQKEVSENTCLREFMTVVFNVVEDMCPQLAGREQYEI